MSVLEMDKSVKYLVLFVLLIAGNNLFAQRYLSTERTVVIPKVLDVGVVAGSTTFSFNTTANYDSGIEKPGLFTVTVKANVNWKLSLTASGAQFSPVSTTTPMPIDVLSLRSPTVDAINYYEIPYPAGLSSTGTRGEYIYSLDLKADPGYLYEQNTYINNLYFVISEP